jgi:hypothetical protein
MEEEAGRILVGLRCFACSPSTWPPPDLDLGLGLLREDMTKELPRSQSLSSLPTKFTTSLTSHTCVGVVPKSAAIGFLECTDDSLPSIEIQLHIVIEVVSRLKMTQEMRSLSVKEHLLVDFLLDQILLLKVIVAQ